MAEEKPVLKQLFVYEHDARRVELFIRFVYALCIAVVSCQLCSVAKYKTYVCHNVVWWIGDEEICCDTFEGGAKVP